MHTVIRQGVSKALLALYSVKINVESASAKQPFLLISPFVPINQVVCLFQASSTDLSAFSFLSLSLSQEEATTPAQASGRKRNAPASEGTENSVTPNPVAASQPPPNKPRRGRPPKNPAAAANKDKEVTTTPGSGAGRGRKRATPSQDSTSTGSAEPISGKIPKQQKETDSKRAGQQRQIDLQR